MSAADTILVIGAGPAGATAARLLAQWGHAVHLVARPRPEGPRGDGLAESLTPSCGKFFDLLGISDAVDAAGFVRTRGNTAWWGTGEARVEPFAGGARGWQVTSGQLEQVMTQAAAEAGAHVERCALDFDAAVARPAAFRLDCSGRAGVLARPWAGRVYEPDHRTVALTAIWTRRDDWPLPDPTHTVIESYGDGWAWSVPLDTHRRAVAVMVDPRVSTLTRGAGGGAAYEAELAKTTQLKTIVAGAQRVGEPLGWDASMYASTRYTGSDWLVAGDAATFVDPLSSAGVKKALASGWLAAVAVHTAMLRPSMAEIALDFYSARETEMYEGYRALTRRYLREAAAGHDRPFWLLHADTAIDPERGTKAALEPALVRDAYERLRSAPELRVHCAPGVRVGKRPAIAGREIVLEPRIVTADMPDGLRFEHDVDVVTLVELAPQFTQVPDLYEAYIQRTGPTGLPTFLTALSGVLARGWLRWNASNDAGNGMPEAEPKVL